MSTQQNHDPDPVRKQTAPQVLDRIESGIEETIREHALQPEYLVTRRIEELKREWDIERVLEMNASIIALSGLILSVTVNRKFLFLTGGVLGFLLQHSITGWCPPVPVFRRLGVRTRSEIDREKFALKAIRGDFRHIATTPVEGNRFAAEVIDAVNR